MPKSVLYVDNDILIARKPAGIPAQPDPSGQPDFFTNLQKEYPSAHLIHRLDVPTGGVMVFGLTPKATAGLSCLIQDHTVFVKEYLCVLAAPPPSPEGEIFDYIYHDKRKNKAFIVNSEHKGAKKAGLSYYTLAKAQEGFTLVSARLYTGRTHQIRVQFASRRLPLYGDGKYGSREKCRNIGLWAYRLSFPHPITGQRISAMILPETDEKPWSYFKGRWDIR